MSDLYEKMISEAISLQGAVVGMLKAKRGERFAVKDADPYLDAVRKMGPGGDQSEAPFALHSASAASHVEAMIGAAGHRRTEDGLAVQGLQASSILDILYALDNELRRSGSVLAGALDEAEALIGQEVARRTGPAPPETVNAIDPIRSVIDGLEIPAEHREALRSALSWSSYRAGEIFVREVERGSGFGRALDAESAALKAFFQSPGHGEPGLIEAPDPASIDLRRYADLYTEGMRSAVREAVDEGVHYANILAIPSYAAGDVSLISQQALDMARDDIVMAVIESAAEVMASSLRGSLGRFRSPDQPLVLAAGSAACAIEYILEMDGFSAPEIIALLGRHRGQSVSRGPGEFHYFDLVDMVYNGWRYIDNTVRKGKAMSEKGLPVPRVTWFEVDLSPIAMNEALAGSGGRTGTSRLSALLRLADCPAIINGASTSALMTNIVASRKGEAINPTQIYRKYVMGRLEGPGLVSGRPGG